MFTDTHICLAKKERLFRGKRSEMDHRSEKEKGRKKRSNECDRAMRRGKLINKGGRFPAHLLVTLTRPTRHGVQRRWDRTAEKCVLHTIVLGAKHTQQYSSKERPRSLHIHKHSTNGKA